MSLNVLYAGLKQSFWLKILNNQSEKECRGNLIRARGTRKLKNKFQRCPTFFSLKILHFVKEIMSKGIKNANAKMNLKDELTVVKRPTMVASSTKDGVQAQTNSHV